MNQKKYFISAITCCFIFISVSFSQVPRFQKYPIENTGAYIYLPAQPTFNISYSDDSSVVYTNETTTDSISYGIIYVVLNEDLGDVAGDWDAMLWSYLQYLNESAFEMPSVTDPGYGHTLDSDTTARGILEYGTDIYGSDMVVEGWVNKYAIAIVYMYSKAEMNYNYQNIYLNSIRFPAQ